MLKMHAKQLMCMVKASMLQIIVIVSQLWWKQKCTSSFGIVYFYNKTYIQKYYVPSDDVSTPITNTSEDVDDEIGGLFRVLKEKSIASCTDRLIVNSTDCSKSHEHDVTLGNIDQVISQTLQNIIILPIIVSASSCAFGNSLFISLTEQNDVTVVQTYKNYN